jgi:CDP-diacylglycerol--glycerol-3-phosphate 3-phosphatidyltransferase
MLLSPAFLVFFLWGGPAGHWLAFVTAFWFEFSDLLDGYFARRRKAVTDFGKLFDPIADSVSRISVFLGMTAAGLCPIWVLAILFYRDILVAGTRMAAATQGIVVSARLSGKVKAVVQAASIFAVLTLVVCQDMNVPVGDVAHRSHLIMAVVALVTAFSGIDYLVGNYGTILRLAKGQS